jgi:hypothetical protein
MNMLPNEIIPQTIPTCIRSNPNSPDISLNKTGMHLIGMFIANPKVHAARISAYHLICGGLPVSAKDNCPLNNLAMFCKAHVVIPWRIELVTYRAEFSCYIVFLGYIVSQLCKIAKTFK